MRRSPQAGLEVDRDPRGLPGRAEGVRGGSERSEVRQHAAQRIDRSTAVRGALQIEQLRRRAPERAVRRLLEVLPQVLQLSRR